MLYEDLCEDGLVRQGSHRKGWLIFQFGSDDDRETVRQKGPFEIFGIPLVLQPMPENFEPDMEHEVNVPLWIRLVDLPLALWNFTAISKIASCFGTPIFTDFSTLRRESLDGPRVQVIINTALRPKTSITVQLPNGPYEQKVEYEFYPSFCNAFKMYGHFADDCRGRKSVYEQHEQHGAWPRAKSNDRARSKSRPHAHYGEKAFNKEWPKLGGNKGVKKMKGVLGAKPAPAERSRSRTRQEWVPTGGYFEKPINASWSRPRKESSLNNPRGLPKRMQGDPNTRMAEQNGEASRNEAIPTSPNRFEALAGDEGAAPEDVTLGQEDQPENRSAEQIEHVKDLLTAAIAPILAGLNGMPTAQRQNGRGRSRDPRTPRSNTAAEESQQARAPVEGVSMGPRLVPMRTSVRQRPFLGLMRIQKGNKALSPVRTRMALSRGSRVHATSRTAGTLFRKMDRGGGADHHPKEGKEK